MTPTSRVSDEMVNAAIKVYQTRAYKRLFESASAIPDPAGDMRAAIEAALSTMGDVVAWQYRNVFKNEKSHKWHFIDKEQFDRWSEQDDPSIELRRLYAESAILNRGGK